MVELPEIVYIKTEDLKLNPGNPRQIGKKEFQKLVKSLQECPQMLKVRPLLVSNRTGENVIIGGNMRYRAAKELDYEEMPCVFIPEPTEEQEREIAIKDNGAFGEWDWDVLANEWHDLPLADWGLDVPKDWDSTDRKGEMLALVDFTLEVDFQVKTGEAYLVEENVLYCGKVTTDWPRYSKYLKDGAMLIPYGTPFCLLIKENLLVVVNPDLYLCALMLTKAKRAGLTVEKL